MNKIRIRGALLLIANGFAFALILQWVYTHQLEQLRSGAWALISIAIPGALGLFGLAQLIAGVPLEEMAGFWDDLHSWQRGIIGLSLVFLAFLLLSGTLLMLARMRIF